MSAFGDKADMIGRGSPLSRSLLGGKRTWVFALHISACDPKRTSTQCNNYTRFTGGGDHVPSATAFFGAYRRSASSIPPCLGAGNQFACRSAEGGSAWT